MWSGLLFIFALAGTGALAADEDDDFEFDAPKTSGPKKPTPPVDDDLDELESPDWQPSRADLDDDPPEDDRDLRGLGEERDAPRCPDPAPKISATGKAPLADNYPVQIVARDLDAVTLELPVLVSQSRADWNGADGWLVAEVLVNGSKVAESRSRLIRDGLAELSPSLLWIKAQVPVSQPSGAIEVKVSLSPDGGQPRALFTRKAEYKL